MELRESFRRKAKPFESKRKFSKCCKDLITFISAKSRHEDACSQGYEASRDEESRRAEKKQCSSNSSTKDFNSAFISTEQAQESAFCLDEGGEFDSTKESSDGFTAVKTAYSSDQNNFSSRIEIFNCSGQSE